MSHRQKLDQSRPANRLARETSPYLLQHARNPVDWYPWGEEALRKARELDRPILLSIGYSACHWCHVMERESFEDEGIAGLMNDSFVCIKVDREERPDLDEIYMAATLAMNHGQGGWPMTLFLTPDQKPFFAGTYFPPHDAYGRPGFGTLLSRLSDLWRGERSSLCSQAARLHETLSDQAGAIAEMAVGTEAIARAAAELAQDFDVRHGGFGDAPKFPPSMALHLLLRQYRRTRDPQALAMVGKTLEAMARGGMYDQVGGGFHRYSTDDRWLVPHFEKMLYDNALLAGAYLEGYQATHEPFFARIAREILDYVLTEMTSPEGAFYCSTDADSEGEEGRFFVWTPQEITSILGREDGRAFCAAYDITPGGNWEGKSIPNVPRDAVKVADDLGIAPEELEALIARARPLVYAARKKRAAPSLDDKVLTAWNGLAIGALARGAWVLGEARYLAAAEAAASFLLSTLSRPDGRLLRTYRAGRAHIDAYLEDYAYLAEGLIDLYEAGAPERYLHEALRLGERITADFGSADGPFYNTSSSAEALILRGREGNDGATPSPNASAASALARLSYHFDRADLREAAIRAIRAYGRMIARHPRAFCKSLAVIDFLLEGPTELALVGAADRADTRALRAAVARPYLPNRIAAHHDPEGAPSRLPLLAGKPLVNGRTALYVCRDFACSAPVTDPEAVPAALEAVEDRSLPVGTIGRRLPGSATAEATRSYASRHSQGSMAGYRPLAGTGLSVSCLGFGGYRIDDEEPAFAAALGKALRSGCNLIDTSTNYTDGGSERCVGKALRDLVATGGAAREEIVVVTKIGYVQGQNLELAEARARDGKPFPEMVTYMEGCWHCIHPEWLADQLRRSLDRLDLEAVDVVLLHNPEYYLSDALKHGERNLDKLRDRFYERVGRAFAFFEGEVAAGRMRCYGVTSNTAGVPASQADATSVSRMIEAARAAGGPSNHFKVLQLPLNLFESGPVFEKNTGPGGSQTALEAARAHGLAVLANRPVNAIRGDSMTRLADPPPTPANGDLEKGVRSELATLGLLEDVYVKEIAPKIQVPKGATPPASYFRWSGELIPLVAHVESLPHWKQIEGQTILPELGHVVSVLERRLAGDVGARFHDWSQRYLQTLDGALAAFRRLAARRSKERSDAVAARIDPALPEERRRETLSRKALWVVASTPGITTVLCGMRSEPYVDDALGIMGFAPLLDSARVYRAAHR